MSLASVILFAAAVVAIAAASWLFMQQENSRKHENRVTDFHLEPQFQPQSLTRDECDRFTAKWRVLQERFLDDPPFTVAQGDYLVKQALQAKGYPTRDFEQHIANLSVEDAAVLVNFRIAREIALNNEQGQAATGELRRAMQHYRYIFDNILDTPMAAPIAESHRENIPAAVSM